jgi:small subunit ribosomal protein S2
MDSEAEKLNNILSGIKEMNHLPGLVIIVDAKKEKIAVSECKKLGIPIIAILDTNADPDPIDFPIAGNDDAIKSIRVLLHELVDAATDAMGSLQHLGDTDADRMMPLRTYVSEEDRGRGKGAE